MTRVINLNRIDPEQVVVEYGDMRLDLTHISALHAFRLMNFREKFLAGTADPTEAVTIVLDAIRDANPDISEEQLLAAAPLSSLLELIATVTGEIMQTSQIEQTGPFETEPETGATNP